MNKTHKKFVEQIKEMMEEIKMNQKVLKEIKKQNRMLAEIHKEYIEFIKKNKVNPKGFSFWHYLEWLLMVGEVDMFWED